MNVTAPKYTKENGFVTCTLCGILASSTTSVILAMIMSVLISNSFIGQEFISIGAVVINFVSVIMGTILIGYMKGENKLPAVLLYVTIHILLFMCLGMIFFAVDKSMILSNSISILCGGAAATLLMQRRKKHHEKRNRKRHYR